MVSLLHHALMSDANAAIDECEEHWLQVIKPGSFINAVTHYSLFNQSTEPNVPEKHLLKNLICAHARICMVRQEGEPAVSRGCHEGEPAVPRG